jgi:hypothetical protein
MDYRDHIINRSQEFRNILSNYHALKSTVKVGNSTHIKTINQVTYKQTGEGKYRIGKNNDALDKKFMSIRLDLPKDEFSDEFILRATGFSEIIPRRRRTNYTCLKLHRASLDQTVFDTIDIKLYENDIAKYRFNTVEFLTFIDLLIRRATGEIIEIPKII